MKLHPSVASVQQGQAAARRRAYLEQLLCRGAVSSIVEEYGQPAVPIVDAVRLHDHRGRIVAVELRCPWCGERHTHSAGPKPGDGKGRRYSHCTGRLDINSGYIVREVA